MNTMLLKCLMVQVSLLNKLILLKDNQFTFSCLYYKDTMTKQVFKEKIYPMYIKAINGSGTSNVSKQRKNEK